MVLKTVSGSIRKLVQIEFFLSQFSSGSLSWFGLAQDKGVPLLLQEWQAGLPPTPFQEEPAFRVVENNHGIALT